MNGHVCNLRQMISRMENNLITRALLIASHYRQICSKGNNTRVGTFESNTHNDVKYHMVYKHCYRVCKYLIAYQIQFVHDAILDSFAIKQLCV